MFETVNIQPISLTVQLFKTCESKSKPKTLLHQKVYELKREIKICLPKIMLYLCGGQIIMYSMYTFNYFNILMLLRCLLVIISLVNAALDFVYLFFLCHSNSISVISFSVL